MTNNISKHYCINIQRSKFYEDTIIMRILKSIGYLVLFAYAIVFGLFIDNLLLEIAPNVPFVKKFCYFILIGFILDYMLKVVFKSSKIFNVMPYITLPIPRRRVFGVALKYNFFSVLNFIGVAILMPSFIKMAVLGRISFFVAIGFTLLILAVSLLNSSIVRFAKSFVGLQVIGIISLISSIYLSIAYYVFTYNSISLIIFKSILSIPFVFVIALLIAIIAYLLALSQCRREFYKISETKIQSNKLISNASHSIFNGLSPVLKLSLRMLLRNKVVLIPMVLFQLTSILIIFVVMRGAYCEWYLPLFGFGAVIAWISGFSPFSYYASYAFDGLQTNVPEFSYKMAIAYHKIWLVTSAFVSLMNILVTNEYLLFITCGLSVSLFEYIYLNGIIYAKKRIDVLRSFTQTNSVDFRVVLCGFEAMAIVGGFILSFFLFDKMITCIAFSAISVAFLITSKRWTRQIYIKFKQHRYENMAGFRGDN